MLGERYREGLRRYFAKLCAKYGIRNGFYDDGDEEEEAESPGDASAPGDAAVVAAPEAEQLGLEL